MILPLTLRSLLHQALRWFWWKEGQELSHFVRNAANLTASLCGGDAARFADEVDTETHSAATVQEIIDLEGKSGALKLTVANYLRPSGKNIQRPRNATEKGEWGVTPDEVMNAKAAHYPFSTSDRSMWRNRITASPSTTQNFSTFVSW